MGIGSSWLHARRVSFLGMVVFVALFVCQDAKSWTMSMPQAGAPASTSTVRLQNAVRRLNTSLASNAYAEDWRRLLLLNVLETQSARGEQADINMLRKINERFSREAKAVDDPTFVDVRNALQDQIVLLTASQVDDLDAELSNARGQYRPISTADMSAQRDLARGELLLLKTYYRKTMTSGDRANLFYDLKLNEALELLDTIKFELAPEISVGKMTSMIRDVQKKLDEVILQIDAIPLVPDPDKQEADPAKPKTEQANDDKAQEEDPTPDQNQKSMAELKQEKSELEAQIKKLQDQRAEIRKSDTPRRNERGQTFNALRAFELNFAEFSQEIGDPYFVSATTTFERFVRIYFYGTSDNLREEYLVRLATLERDMEGIDGPDQREVAAKVGSSLQWMENANQIPHVVAAIRARHSLPNVYFSVSVNFLNKIGSQPVTDVQRVRENVGGRLVRGIARTSGQVSIELQDDPNQIHATIRLQGTVGSKTYIQQGKLQVCANTTGQIAAWRSICANIGGLFAEDPVVAANFCASFAGTSSRLRIINRIARKKFGEAKGQGERLTTRKAKDELYKSFKERTDEPIQNGRGELAKLLERMVAESQHVPEIYFRSSTSEIVGVAKKSAIAALAAQDVPKPSNVPTDVSFRIHDSTLSIYLDKTFSGKTFTDKKLAEEIGKITGDEPVSLSEDTGQEDQSFSITFATVRPVQFEFDDNRFSVVVSGRRFAQGDKKINEGLKIILRFKIKQIDGKLKFVRDGEAEVEYLFKVRRPVTVAFRSFLLGRLNPKESGNQISADLPDNLLPIENMEVLQDSPIANRLDLVQCRSENGWLYVGWNYRPENTNPVWQVDLPAIWHETISDDSTAPASTETQSSGEPVSVPPVQQNAQAGSEVTVPAN